MRPALLVPFGLKDGKLFEPGQVLNGKACGCVCPACKRPLIARQGAASPHFAHAQAENCSTGFETAVHLAVKQIIAEKRLVRLPAVVWEDLGSINYYSKTLYTERTLRLDSVHLEYKIGDFRPDIVVSSGSETYLIEVAVTHFIKEEKQQKIKKEGIATFEIDVSDLKGGFTLESLERAIYTTKDYQAEWIYHPRLEQLELEATRAEEERAARIEEANRRRREKIEKYKNRSPTEKLETNLRYLGLTRQQMESLSVFVPWDNSFGVPRIVWQSAVLAYIGRKQEKHEGYWGSDLPCVVNTSACLSGLNDVFEIKSKVKNGERIAVWKYFRHLEQMGILKYLSYNEFDVALKKAEWGLLARK